jgi:hypothetical protein
VTRWRSPCLRRTSRTITVSHTWLLAQARAGRIPHHRLGHYVRFSADDLKLWLQETRCGDGAGRRVRRRSRTCSECQVRYALSGGRDTMCRRASA